MIVLTDKERISFRAYALTDILYLLPTATSQHDKEWFVNNNNYYLIIKSYLNTISLLVGKHLIENFNRREEDFYLIGYKREDDKKYDR